MPRGAKSTSRLKRIGRSAASGTRGAKSTPSRGPSLRARLQRLEGLFLDCDGVLTPGDLLYDERGTRLLRFHARDGFGIALLCRTGLPVVVLSGRPLDVAEHRMKELGVARFVGRCRDKGVEMIRLCEELGIRPESSAFVGDDIPDLAAFEHCGMRIAVADAAAEVRAAADWVTRAPGGRGAVREVCEAILKARGDWQAAIDRVRGA
jgi:3-deoxy-D-manno-octulosonate 8-phosphate phosphatase (KDO 8-P phosphatase)